MKINGLLIIVICMIGLSGCTSKGFDIERVYQFVEIQSSNGKEIGTIVNSDDLEFFFEEMKFQEWKYIEEKEDFGKCIYKFIAYEFVKDDEEYCIREDPYELYKVDDNYYIIQDSDVISIPKSAGQLNLYQKIFWIIGKIELSIIRIVVMEQRKKHIMMKQLFLKSLK